MDWLAGGSFRSYRPASFTEQKPGIADNHYSSVSAGDGEEEEDFGTVRYSTDDELISNAKSTELPSRIIIHHVNYKNLDSFSDYIYDISEMVPSIVNHRHLCQW